MKRILGVLAFCVLVGGCVEMRPTALPPFGDIVVQARGLHLYSNPLVVVNQSSHVLDVLVGGYPVSRVVHYTDKHGWTKEEYVPLRLSPGERETVELYSGIYFNSPYATQRVVTVLSADNSLGADRVVHVNNMYVREHGTWFVTDGELSSHQVRYHHP
jgi:hypothetical protein